MTTMQMVALDERRGKDDGSQQHHAHDNCQKYPVHPESLEVIDQSPFMLVRGAYHSEKDIKHQQRDSASQPAAKKFPKNYLPAGHGLCQQGKQSAILPLRRDLPGGSPDRHDGGGNPNQAQTDFLQIADNFFIVEKIRRRHQQRDQCGQNKQDVKNPCAGKVP